MARNAHPHAMAPSKPGRTRTAPPQLPDKFPMGGRYLAYTLFDWTGLIYLLMGFMILADVWSLGSGEACIGHKIAQAWLALCGKTNAIGLIHAAIRNRCLIAVTRRRVAEHGVALVERRANDRSSRQAVVQGIAGLVSIAKSTVGARCSVGFVRVRACVSTTYIVCTRVPVVAVRPCRTLHALTTRAVREVAIRAVAVRRTRIV